MTITSPAPKVAVLCAVCQRECKQPPYTEVLQCLHYEARWQQALLELQGVVPIGVGNGGNSKLKLQG